MKRRILIVTLLVLVLFLALPVGAVYWILHTTSGLEFALSQLHHLDHIVRIRAGGVRGNLVDGVRIATLDIGHERVGIHVEDISLRVAPHALLLQQVKVEDAMIGSARVEVYSARHVPEPGTPLRFLPSFLRISTRDAHLRSATVVLPGHHEILANRLRSDLLLTSRHLRLRRAFADSGYFTAAGSFDLGAAEPITLAADVDWTLKVDDRAPWRGHARASGDLEELQVSAEQVAPMKATVKGKALALTHQAHWQAQLQGAHIDLRALHPSAKLAVADVDLDVRGDLQGMQVDGTLRPTTLPTGVLHLSARGPYPGRHVQIDDLKIDAGGDVHVDARMTLDVTDSGPSLDLSGTARNFRWPIVGEAVVHSSAASFSLAGERLPYRFSVRGDARVPKLPVFEAQASGLLYTDHLRIETGHAGWINGQVQAQGNLAWTEGEPWNFDIRAQDLDPAALSPDWPGRIGLAASMTGRGLGSDADFDLHLQQAQGTLRNSALKAAGRIRRHGSTLGFDHVVAHLADAQLQVDGTYGNPRDIRISLDAPHLDRLVPGLEGGIKISGRIAGPRGTARLNGTLTGHDLGFSRLTLESVHAGIDLDLSDRHDSQLDFLARGVSYHGQGLGTVKAGLEGRASNHRFTIDSAGGLIDLHGAISGSYDPKGWRGTIGKLDLHNADIVNVHLQSPAAISASADAAHLEPVCLLGTGERVCVQGNWSRRGPFDLQAQGSGIPLRAIGANFATRPDYSGLLGFDLQAQGTSLMDITGHLTAELAEGRLRYKLPSGRDAELLLGNGNARIIATPEQVSAQLHIAATEQSQLDVKLAGRRTAGQDLWQTPITGEIHTQAHELGFLAVMVDQIDRSVGEMNADLDVSGTLGAPRLDGSIQLHKGELDFYQVNLLMRAIEARIDVSGTQVKLSGSSKIGDGTANIDGQLDWQGRRPQGQFTLKGSRLMLVNVPELRADASPDLAFRIDGRRVDVSGTITIPYARIKPADLTGAQLASGDEVILGEQNSAEDLRLQVYTDVKLVLGPDVTVDTYGLTGRLTGSVAATSDPSGTARGSGELHIADGKYAAYGRLLDIERGRLIFNGGLVSDPAVDLRAVKVFPDVTAGVNVRGKLRNPQLSFFSDPPLPQSQIVSVLVAGGTIESLQKSGTQQVGQARNELLAQGGAIVAQQLGARLGVEDVGLESDTLNQTSLVLGKFLNPRLYVSYGISLSEALNTVKLRYTLSDHWTFKIEAGENRSADLVFTIER